MPRDDRTYITVHDGMPEHPKIEGLSDKAFRVLIDLWCWCSRNKTNGHVRQATWEKRSTPRARRELLAAGLAEAHEDGIFMHDYLEHQRSAEEIEESKVNKREAGAFGNHERWHVRRKVADPNCHFCIANRSQTRSQVG